MNWKLLIQDLLATGLNQSQVADKADLSNSLVSEILSGKVTKMYWERGQKLIALHAERCPQTEPVQ